MTYQEAKEYVKRNYSVDVDSDDYIAIVRIRHNSAVLPDFAIDCHNIQDAEWALIDTSYKQDTNYYGAIHYIDADQPDFPRYEYDLDVEPF